METPVKVAVLLFVLAGSVACIGRSQTFPQTQMLGAKGKEVPVDLGFDDSSKHLTVKLHKKTPFTHVRGNAIADVPYGAIQKLSYQQAKHFRVKEGGGAMGIGCIDNPAVVLTCPGSIGVSMVAILTKGKKHWFYVDYQQNGATKNLTFRLSKSEFEQVLKTAREQTGKDVEMLVSQKGKSPDKK